MAVQAPGVAAFLICKLPSVAAFEKEDMSMQAPWCGSLLKVFSCFLGKLPGVAGQKEDMSMQDPWCGSLCTVDRWWPASVWQAESAYRKIAFVQTFVCRTHVR